MTQELLDIIRQSYQNGQDLTSIQRSLLLAGWSKSQISTAFNQLQLSPALEVTKNSHKKIYFVLVILILVTGLTYVYYQIKHPIDNWPTSSTQPISTPTPAEIITDPSENSQSQIIKAQTPQGTANLTIPPEPQFNTPLAVIEVTSWIPLQSAFVAGIYHFTPESLLIKPHATLQLTYSEESLKGIAKENFKLYHQPASTTYWNELPAQHDPSTNTFTTEIGQLGKYTIAYDNTPPGITINPITVVTSPEGVKEIKNISGTVIDTGVGVQAEEITLWTHHNPSTNTDKRPYHDPIASYDAKGNFVINGSIRFAPNDTEIELIFSATDKAGNSATKSVTVNTQ